MDLREHSQLVLLGTGTPNADPDRSGPAVAVIVNQTPYLIDFGPGVVRRAAAAYEQGVEGLEICRLNRAFVTHLHSDHTAGYPDLILTPWVLGRRRPLEVYGPAGLQAMTEHILRAIHTGLMEQCIMFYLLMLTGNVLLQLMILKWERASCKACTFFYMFSGLWVALIIPMADRQANLHRQFFGMPVN